MFASACHAAPSRVRSQCTSAQFLYLPKRLIFPSNSRRSARHNTFSCRCKHDVSNCRMYFMNCITGSAQLHESPLFHVSRHGRPANLVGAVNGSGMFRTARALLPKTVSVLVPPGVCVELGRWNSLPGSEQWQPPKANPICLASFCTILPWPVLAFAPRWEPQISTNVLNKLSKNLQRIKFCH
jgi:hypothetical protein